MPVTVELKLNEYQVIREWPRAWELLPLNDVIGGTNFADALGPLLNLREGVNLVKVEFASDSAVTRQMRLLIGDNVIPYYYSNTQLMDFYRMEERDVDQGAARACESWASQISYDEGGYSAQGISINGSQMAADKRQRAHELRLGFRRA